MRDWFSLIVCVIAMFVIIGIFAVTSYVLIFIIKLMIGV